MSPAQFICNWCMMMSITEHGILGTVVTWRLPKVTSCPFFMAPQLCCRYWLLEEHNEPWMHFYEVRNSGLERLAPWGMQPQDVSAATWRYNHSWTHFIQTMHTVTSHTVLKTVTGYILTGFLSRWSTQVVKNCQKRLPCNNGWLSGNIVWILILLTSDGAAAVHGKLNVHNLRVPWQRCADCYHGHIKPIKTGGQRLMLDRIQQRTGCGTREHGRDLIRPNLGG